MADKWIQLMSEDGTDNLFPTSKMDLLWTNASPSSNFAAQTVSLDLNTYKYVRIRYEVTSAWQVLFDFFVDNVKYVAHFVTENNSNSRVRDIVVSSTGITFGNGIANGSTNNAEMKPIKIYGIK